MMKFRFLFVSLAIHVSAFALFGVFSEPLNKILKPVIAKKSERVPVKIGHVSDASQGQRSERPDKQAAKQPKSPNKPTTQADRSASLLGGANLSNQNQVPLTMKDVLPDAWSFKDIPQPDTLKDGKTALGSLESFDNETDSIPYDVRAVNLPNLEVFAQEVAQQISIPNAVKELAYRGEAFVRLQRTKSGWKIKTATGDAYFRAILYDTLEAMGPRHYGFIFLSKTDYTSIRINLAYTTVSGLDRRVRPLATRTDGNKVFIEMTNQKTDPLWQAVMIEKNEQGNALALPNIIGIGKVVGDAIFKSDPLDDISVKRLRNSPAFSRPITEW